MPEFIFDKKNWHILKDFLKNHVDCQQNNQITDILYVSDLCKWDIVQLFVI